MRIRSVGVIGAGTMGGGIAQVAASAGCDVVLRDRSIELASAAVEALRGRIERLRERGRLGGAQADATLARVRPADDDTALGACDLIIEAVFEDLAVKQAALRSAAAEARPDALFATNTSSLSVTQIAGALERPERLAGMHFFNPAPQMPLVEVVAGERTAPDVLETLVETATAWGKTAVRARDVPGFIVNRVARPFYLEALRLLGDGVADVAQIDAAMRALGFPMGPFELMDLVGIDVNYAVSCSVYERLRRPARLAPHDIQRLMREAGTLGRKSGHGFYDYSDGPPRPVETRFARRSAAAGDLPALAPCAEAGAACGAIQNQILLAIINEAGHALDDGVAPERDIDLAMRTGTNYPRGPIEWARSIGIALVRERLALLEQRHAGRFAPARYWLERGA